MTTMTALAAGTSSPSAYPDVDPSTSAPAASPSSISNAPDTDPLALFITYRKPCEQAAGAVLISAGDAHDVSLTNGSPDSTWRHEDGSPTWTAELGAQALADPGYTVDAAAGGTLTSARWPAR
jgi:hypothetical protein